MALLSLIVALLIEQGYPLADGNRAHRWFLRYADFVERHLNATEHRHGVAGWCLAVLPAVLVVALVHLTLGRTSEVLAWIWSVAVLYLTMGFRQFSHFYTEISEALRAGDIGRAQGVLGRWRGASAADLSPSEVARVAIEQGLVGSHQHVFGVLFWFVLGGLFGLGPVGAIVYRQAALLRERWGRRRDAEFGEFGAFAVRVDAWMDWVPARLTGAGFAVVGDFEDAVYCWRAQAGAWMSEASGIILASGAGAMGVRLGEPLRESGEVVYRPELGTGDPADVDSMQSAVGLIWRALVLWILIILLATAASWFGH